MRSLLLLLTAPCAALAGEATPDPLADFAGWHAEWTRAADRSYSVEFNQVWGRGAKPPLVMRCDNWQSTDHRLCIVTNLDSQERYGLLVNPRYAALLVAPLGEGEPRWRLRESVAPRDDPYYEELRDDVGISSAIVHRCDKEFRRPYRIEQDAPAPPGMKATRYVFQDAEAPNRPRAPQAITVVCDPTHGCPVEVRIEERNGGKSRQFLSGWHKERGLGWRPTENDAFFQPPEEAAEKLHSTEAWEFQPPGEDRAAECYLKHYGLPEPRLPTP